MQGTAMMIPTMQPDSDRRLSAEGTLHFDLGAYRDSTIFVIIAFLGCLVYAKSIAYQYTYFDDIFLLVVNHDFLSNTANLQKLFTTDVFITVANPVLFYRPLMNVLFMAEMQIASTSTAVFHVTNIVMHIASSMLLFVLMKQLRFSKGAALAAALIFCVHPLNTSAVVWIPGRNDVLMTLLVLSSFSLMIRSLDTGNKLFLAAHFATFFLALLTKEAAVALPFMMAGYILLVRKEYVRRNVLIWAGTAYLLLVTAWFLLRTLVPRTFQVHEPLGVFISSWLSNLPACLLYLGKSFLPVNLSIFPNFADSSFLYGIIAIVGLILVLLVDWRIQHRLFWGGLIWFFVFLAPSLVSGNIFYEHRAYCSLAGLIVSVADLPMMRRIDFSKSVHVLFLVSVLAVFGILTMFHSEEYRNRYSFATSALSGSPSIDESYSSLAGMYLDERSYDDAERAIQAGLRRNPFMKSLHRMLGDIYSARHQYADATREYELSLKLEPLQLYTYINFGKMCLDAGRPDDAVRLWKRSVFLNPQFLVGYEYLANFYTYTRNDPDSAMLYVKDIQRRGVEVMPELLRAIESNPKYGKRKQ